MALVVPRSKFIIILRLLGELMYFIIVLKLARSSSNSPSSCDSKDGTHSENKT